MSQLPRWARASFVGAAAGTIVAVYLTLAHVNRGVLICGIGDCAAVPQSQYATVGPVPISLLGLGLFGAVAASGVLRWRFPQWAATITTVAFGLGFGGVLYSVYLTYLELAVIRAICQWCVVSALLIVVIVIAEGCGVLSLVIRGEPWPT